jgi:hypothetical protein
MEAGEQGQDRTSAKGAVDFPKTVVYSAAAFG